MVCARTGHEDVEQQAWSQYLLGELDAFAAPMGWVDAHVIRELANGVAMHCMDRASRGLTGDEVHAALGRACWSVGRQDVARRIFDERVTSVSVRNTLLQLLAIGAVSPLLWNLVVSGALAFRAASALSGSASGYWRLDLGRLGVDPEELELVSSAVLRHVVKALSPLWHQTNGSGILAIRPAPSEDLANRKQRMDPLRYVKDLLQQESAHRAWQEKPHVVRLG